MKKFLFLMVVAGIAGPVLALDAEEKQLVCPAMGALAANVMQKRQEGVAMSVMIEATKRGEPEVDDITLTVIQAAYAGPRMLTDEMIKRQVDDFRNTIEAICYK